MNYSLYLSAVYPYYGDSRRIFAQGNQEQLPYLMAGCLKNRAPTPERTSEDISGRPAVAKKIVEA